MESMKSEFNKKLGIETILYQFRRGWLDLLVFGNEGYSMDDKGNLKALTQKKIEEISKYGSIICIEDEMLSLKEQFKKLYL